MRRVRLGLTPRPRPRLRPWVPWTIAAVLGIGYGCALEDRADLTVALAAAEMQRAACQTRVDTLEFLCRASSGPPSTGAGR